MSINRIVYSLIAYLLSTLPYSTETGTPDKSQSVTTGGVLIRSGTNLSSTSDIKLYEA